MNGPRGSKSFISFEKDSLVRLNNLTRAIDQYPNRIERAMMTAAIMTEKQLRTKLKNEFNNRKLADEDVVTFGVKSTKQKLTITVGVLVATGYDRSAKRQPPEIRARFDANIKMYGRMRYTAKKSPGETPYNLTNRFDGLNKASYGITVRRISPNQRFRKLIKRDTVGIYGKNLKTALRREGFGQRGGFSGTDIKQSAIPSRPSIF